MNAHPTDPFARLDTAVVEDDPFPHFIVPDLIDPEICRRLIAELPPLDVISNGEPLGNNQQFWLSARETSALPELSPTWRMILEEGVSDRFMGRLTRKFAPAIAREYPQIEADYGLPAERLPTVVRQKGELRPGVLNVDAQIMINSPAVVPGTVARGPHIDRPKKLFVGLLYLRAEGDDSTGGDLELCEALDAVPRFAQGGLLPRERVRLRKTVPYRTNLFAAFVNTPRSLHGISPRSATPFPRVLMNFLGEFDRPLFGLSFLPGEGPQPRPQSWWQRLRGAFGGKRQKAA